MVFVRGLLFVGLFVPCLLLTAPGCGKKDGGEAPKGGSADNAKAILGKWKHKDKTEITLDFGAKSVKWKGTKDGSSPSGEGTYSVEGKTLELPKFNKPFDEKVTIDSISADKLVLSGGETWKFDKTEFTKEK